MLGPSWQTSSLLPVTHGVQRAHPVTKVHGFLAPLPVTAMVSLSPAAAITLTALFLLELLQRPAPAAWKGLGPQPAGSGAQSTLHPAAAVDAAQRVTFVDRFNGVNALVWHEWPSCARWLRHCIVNARVCCSGVGSFDN
jgi:hypothetical protein